MFNRFIRRFGSYFLQGVLLAVPIAATIYVVYKLFTAIDNILPFDIPGLGIIVLIIFLTLLGFLGTTIIADPIMAYFTRLLNKAPLLKSIYSAVKDLTTAFVGKKKSFTEPVLVKMMIDSSRKDIMEDVNRDLEPQHRNIKR